MVYTRQDSLLTCPLDESHRILRSRMQFHLVRCLKNHKLGIRLKCPWNPLHIISKFAYEDHYKRECEDMPAALDFMCETEESYDVGSVPVTATNGLLPPTKEDWDAEPAVGTYDPSKNAEGKPVLRLAVGLSKAKKKQWRQAERKRFQALEENGPIQIKPRQPEKSVDNQDIRPPREIGMVLAMKNCTINELNSNQLAKDNKEVQKDKGNVQELRMPHEPSSALTYKANHSDKGNGAYPKKIPLDSDKTTSSEGESRVVNDVPNLCQLTNNSIYDTVSRKSDTSSHDVDAIRKTFENNIRIANIINSKICVPEAQNSALLDEAAGVPNLLAPISDSANDAIIALSQSLDLLANEQKKIDELKSCLIRQISQYYQVPNLVSSNASLRSLNLHDKKHDDGVANASLSVKDTSPPVNQQNNLPSNGIPKCAANFSKSTRNLESQTVGMGRGMAIVLDSSRNSRPGSLKEEIKVGVNSNPHSPDPETDPFATTKTILSTANADDDTDLVYEKEEDD